MATNPASTRFIAFGDRSNGSYWPFAAIRKLGIDRVQSFAPLGFLRPAAFLVAHQNSSRLVPVGQHPALAEPAVDAVLVPGGAVGVAVDQPRIAVLAQYRFHRAAVDIHDFGWLAAFFLLAPRAQRPDLLFAQGERQGKKFLPPGGRAYLGAKPLIVDVVCAKRVAVHEQRARLEQIEAVRIADQAGVARRGEGSAE